jgi:OmpA-OmpF porin, OOP family
MLKRIITVSVLSASAFSIVAANATTAHDETINPATTATSGLYVLGQAGYANAHTKDTIVTPLPSTGSGFSIPNWGLGGRLGMGYQFNQNFAVEMGYLRLINKKGTFEKLAPTSAYQAGATETLKQNVIDLAAKGILPITDKINAYGKLGVAYLTSIITGKNENEVKSNDNQFFGIDKHTFAPEVGLGITYNITNNIFVDASLTHIQPVGKNKPGNVDFAAVGMGYSFG